MVLKGWMSEAERAKQKFPKVAARPPGNRLAGQYYVEVEGRFLLDDVPSRSRTELRGVLEEIRGQGRN